MYAIKGYFDGKEIKPLEPFPIKGKAEVIITILEPDGEFRDLVKLSESSLDFWDNVIDDNTWNHA